jgi:hypothetical protein
MSKKIDIKQERKIREKQRVIKKQINKKEKNKTLS